jgi:hypothetical protein
MKETYYSRSSQLRPRSRLGRSVLAVLMIAFLAAGIFFRVPRAWAAGRAQVGTELNEATESIGAQEGLDESDGQNNDLQLNEAQEGVDELEGQNNDAQLSEGQEGVDELEGQNNDSQLSEGQEGIDELDGANNHSRVDESQAGSNEGDGQNGQADGAGSQ